MLHDRTYQKIELIWSWTHPAMWSAADSSGTMAHNYWD